MLTAPAALAQDKATIDKLNADFMAAFDKGDMAAIGQMYTEDAYLLPFRRPDWSKAAPPYKRSGRTLPKASETSSSQPWTLRPSGVMRLARSAPSHLKTKGDKPQEVAGKYVVVWEKTGGQWKLATDIWNADK